MSTPQQLYITVANDKNYLRSSTIWQLMYLRSINISLFVWDLIGCCFFLSEPSDKLLTSRNWTEIGRHFILFLIFTFSNVFVLRDIPATKVAVAAWHERNFKASGSWNRLYLLKVRHLVTKPTVFVNNYWKQTGMYPSLISYSNYYWLNMCAQQKIWNFNERICLYSGTNWSVNNHLSHGCLCQYNVSCWCVVGNKEALGADVAHYCINCSVL